ncbi:unnamed protein product, partial [Scytosiphon promiscuus]
AVVQRERERERAIERRGSGIVVGPGPTTQQQQRIYHVARGTGGADAAAPAAAEEGRPSSAHVFSQRVHEAADVRVQDEHEEGVLLRSCQGGDGQRRRRQVLPGRLQRSRHLQLPRRPDEPPSPPVPPQGRASRRSRLFFPRRPLSRRDEKRLRRRAPVPPAAAAPTQAGADQAARVLREPRRQGHGAQPRPGLQPPGVPQARELRVRGHPHPRDVLPPRQARHGEHQQHQDRRRGGGSPPRQGQLRP